MAVLPSAAKTPTRVERLPNDLPKLKRFLDRLAREGELRACYEASGAGYVIHRARRAWGYACDVLAPSLIPKRPGVPRKHDKRDASDLARLYRAGELTTVRIPSEAEERVRDVVRCRETFQREILKARHYILKFLARRGLVVRDGTNWCTPHLRWLQHLTTDQSPLAPADRLVFREYHASIMRCSRTSCSGATNSIGRSRDSPNCRRWRRWCVGSSASAALRGRARWCWPRKLSIGGASNGRRNWRRISAWSRVRTRVAIANAKARSRRRGIVMVGTCSCRPRGALIIARRSARTSNDGRRGNRRR